MLGDSDAENEDFSEVNENEKHIVDMDTMWDNYDPYQTNMWWTP